MKIMNKYSLLIISIILVASNVFAASIELNIKIHPLPQSYSEPSKLKPYDCSKMFGLNPQDSEIEALNYEPDYKMALANDWVSLASFDYKKDRQFYPCLQNIKVEFPDIESLYQFAIKMNACCQYPFYAAADYELQMAIFEYAVKSGDIKLYEILMKLDDRGCASELNAVLHSILRKNPAVMMDAFSRMDSENRYIAVHSQYDINKPLYVHILSDETISSLPEHLRPSAKEFNDIMKQIAQETHK